MNFGNIFFNAELERWENTSLRIWSWSRNGLLAESKRVLLDIPKHEFLSNRFVLRNVEEGDKDGL